MPQLHQAEAQKLDQLVFPNQQAAPSARRLQAVGIGRQSALRRDGVGAKWEPCQELVEPPNDRLHVQLLTRGIGTRG